MIAKQPPPTLFSGFARSRLNKVSLSMLTERLKHAYGLLKARAGQRNGVWATGSEACVRGTGIATILRAAQRSIGEWGQEWRWSSTGDPTFRSAPLSLLAELTILNDQGASSEPEVTNSTLCSCLSSTGTARSS